MAGGAGLIELPPEDAVRTHRKTSVGGFVDQVGIVVPLDLCECRELKVHSDTPHNSHLGERRYRFWSRVCDPTPLSAGSRLIQLDQDRLTPASVAHRAEMPRIVGVIF